MSVLEFIGQFIYYTWFIWALFILLPLAKETWISWRQKLFEHHMSWAMLEIMIPREIVTSPKAMEQIFLQLWSFKNYPGNIKEKWWQGEITFYHSFEIVGMDGEIHFYVRTPRHLKDFVEAAFFAYYPDVEISEVEDYMKRYPSTVQKLYAEGYKMYGTELLLNKSAAYPIRNYTEFESPDENKQYDPMSVFIESMSRLGPGEMCGIQILCWPAMIGDPHDKHAAHEYAAEVVKVRERKEEATHGGHDEGDAGILRKVIMSRTPGETETLTAMDENLARPMYSSVIRLVYAAPSATYTEQFPRRAIIGAFNQYGAADINSFSGNADAATRGVIWEWPFIWPDLRKEYRRQRIWHDFRHREIPPHTFIGRLLTSYLFNLYFGANKSIHLNTRSLASLWHPPTHAILTGPHIRRIESKKAGPPAGIDIFGEEKELQKFQ